MDSLTIDRLITLISLAISIGALWHTYSVNRSFAKNQLIIDQVKAVNELVNYLNRKKIQLKFTSVSEDGSSRGSRSGEVTLFELTDVAKDFEALDNAPVLLDSNRCNEVFEFLKYLNDPLIPLTIAKQLSKFMNGHNFIVKPYSEYNDNNIVVVESGVRYAYDLLQYTADEMRDKLIVGNATALVSWLSFKTCATDLRKEINKWLKSKAIDDLNIRSEFQAY